MGCNIRSFPSTYLGLPLGVEFKFTEIWNGVVENFEKRLATWQMQYLSLAGRPTLINSVLDSLPTCYMALFPMPTEVLQQIDKIRRVFLWEGNNQNHKFHLLKWEVIQQKYHGLGINLAFHNKSTRRPLLFLMVWDSGRDDYPELFKIAQDPNFGIVANREGTNWYLTFRRDMHDWEVNDLIDRLARLQHCHINPQTVDKLKWGYHKDHLMGHQPL
ncbi:hypothetical protein H5410_021511 [Solanum commersonii]|uniref:Uncharacterized protein n=1 Tax=Solanum commersonii TaxID=4109 RepID=A0A9J5ZHF2_SOLCO|nr:hypothetical protein H5410_021511 [Solanum commersonii]